MFEIESLAIGVKIVVGMSITVGLLLGAAVLKTILRHRPRYARPNYRKGSLTPTDKISCWRVLTILGLLGIMAGGCTTLPNKTEFLALECKEQTALLYDFAKENRALAIGGVVTGVIGIGTGVAGIVAAGKVGDGVKALANGMP
jgi:hypothetical protein